MKPLIFTISGKQKKIVKKAIKRSRRIAKDQDLILEYLCVEWLLGNRKKRRKR